MSPNKLMGPLTHIDGNDAWQVRDPRRGPLDWEVTRFHDPDGNRGPRPRPVRDEDAARVSVQLTHEAQAAREWAQERLRAATAPLDELARSNTATAEKPGKGMGVNTAAVNEVKTALNTVPPLIVREYAAPRPGGADAAPENPETVLWEPVLVLPADGTATLPFHLGTAEGGYQIIVAGHTLDGRIGATRGLIKVGP